MWFVLLEQVRIKQFAQQKKMYVGNLNSQYFDCTNMLHCTVYRNAWIQDLLATTYYNYGNTLAFAAFSFVTPMLTRIDMSSSFGVTGPSAPTAVFLTGPLILQLKTTPFLQGGSSSGHVCGCSTDYVSLSAHGISLCKVLDYKLGQ